MAKTIITADLHFGIHEQYDEIVESFLQNLQSLGEIDSFVIIGDVAESLELDSRHFGNNHKKLFKLIQQLPVENIAFCAGNHDIWTNRGLDSWEILTERLKALADDSGVTYLEANNLYTEEAAIVGTMGHYDYSLATKGLEINGIKVEDNHYETKTPPGYETPLWNDALYIHWSYGDKGACEKICSAFDTRLDEAMKKRDRIIVATHTVPMLEMNGHQYKEKPMSNFLNAFSGTARLGEIILSHANKGKSIKAFSGHTHLAAGPILINDVEFHNIGSDYGTPKFIVLER